MGGRAAREYTARAGCAARAPSKKIPQSKVNWGTSHRCQQAGELRLDAFILIYPCRERMSGISIGKSISNLDLYRVLKRKVSANTLRRTGTKVVCT
jgi:hypothetical protein